ncbi:PAAR domain-containing protein [Photorhabdus temperata]|uniref:PAAR domain-containing protein n=1 Tax=Photorhabdus temperata TaxID=574560 RepID=UPI00038A3192|nr:PAAR domain-containing protein [Photorhabdus temperata]EQB97886.1 hypothetical protein B738_28247 [Photorhabdus temperata subsp. temperata M1021]
MTNKAVIRLNDLTDHGGKVITAIDNCVYQGVPVAAKGDLVNYPKCKRVFPIVGGKKQYSVPQSLRSGRKQSTYRAWFYP